MSQVNFFGNGSHTEGSVAQEMLTQTQSQQTPPEDAPRGTKANGQMKEFPEPKGWAVNWNGAALEANQNINHLT